MADCGIRLGRTESSSPSSFCRARHKQPYRVFQLMGILEIDRHDAANALRVDVGRRKLSPKASAARIASLDAHPIHLHRRTDRLPHNQAAALPQVPIGKLALLFSISVRMKLLVPLRMP